MNKNLLINNFDLVIDGKTMLSDFSVCLESKQSVCLLGESGSGKSLLLKGVLSNKAWVSSYKVEFYLGETKLVKNWKEEFHFDELNENWKNFLNQFLKRDDNFSYRCAIVSKLLTYPDFFFCEDIHNLFSRSELKMFWEFLKSQNIIVFYVTNSIEDTIYFDYLIVLKNNQIAMEGKTIMVLQEEKLMKLLGFSLPFYVNLSIQLKYYGLLDKICFTKEELEESLWQSK